jgi:hypothetical protein
MGVRSGEHPGIECELARPFGVGDPASCRFVEQRAHDLVLALMRNRY